ncbi:hypothetical protein HY407_02575 [Candidatus Gottesmanbacteria bacterium]|nr:hypothetical protein [Candidatus Gottesmanbacteria bacterium]
MAEQLTIGTEVRFKLGDNPLLHEAKVVGYNPDNDGVIFYSPPHPDTNSVIIQPQQNLPGFYRIARYGGTDAIRHSEADSATGEIRAGEVTINHLSREIGIVFERAPSPPTE